MKDNPRSASTLWQAVNQIIVRYSAAKSKLPENLSLDSVNDFFRTIAVTPTHQPATMFAPTPVSLPQTPYNFTFQSITVSEVFSQLQALDVRKSVRPDGICARFMREVAAEIASPLTSIFNKSLCDGCVPHMWKCSNVTPVYKGGNVDDPGNYRPISVVSVAVKVLEKLLATQLHNYLEKHKLFHHHQGAYRHGR